VGVVFDEVVGEVAEEPETPPAVEEPAPGQEPEAAPSQIEAVCRRLRLLEQRKARLQAD
jgi:hypothetical protein